jgi:hypothetical protein
MIVKGFKANRRSRFQVLASLTRKTRLRHQMKPFIVKGMEESFNLLESL